MENPIADEPIHIEYDVFFKQLYGRGWWVESLPDIDEMNMACTLQALLDKVLFKDSFLHTFTSHGRRLRRRFSFEKE